MTEDLEGEIPHLRAYARSLCRNVTRADDLVQETLLKAIKNHEKFREGTNLRAWLFTILRNTFITEQRKFGRETALPEEADVFLSGAPGNQEDSIEFENLVRAMHSLPPDFREALILIGAAGISYEEAAQIMGCRVGTAKSRVSRARALVREMLETGAKLPSRHEARATFADINKILAPGMERRQLKPVNA